MGVFNVGLGDQMEKEMDDIGQHAAKLRNAKEEKDTIKVKDPVTVTENDFEKSYTLVTNSFATTR
jgi:hypothetical protein